MLKSTRIATAISNAGMQFDIIGFDAGLTASIENAAALSTYTDYIIASQEEMNTKWRREAGITADG